LPKDQPDYVSDKDCVDHPHYNCEKMKEEGHCYVTPKASGKICAKTCGFCKKYKEHLPFIPEEQRLMRWMDNKPKYKVYVKVIKRIKRTIRKKIAKKEC